MQKNDNINLLIENAINESNDYLEMYKLKLMSYKKNLNNLDNNIPNYEEKRNNLLVEIKKYEEKIIEEKNLIAELKKSSNNTHNVS